MYDWGGTTFGYVFDGANDDRGKTDEQDDPSLYPNRGLNFDGVDDYMQLIDLILNGRFSVTTWIMKQGPGTLLSFISITPTPVPSSVELAFKSGSEILSIYWNEQTTEWIQTPEFDSSWKLLTFIFNFISDDSSIEF